MTIATTTSSSPSAAAAAVPPAPPAVTDKVQQLTALGYSASAAEGALRDAAEAVQVAADKLISRSASAAAPSPIAAGASIQKEMATGEGDICDPDRERNSSRAACRVVTKTGSGSGVLIDGRALGFPHACLLTNEHVIGTPEQAASATVFFNYEDSNCKKWLEANLDLSSVFIANKDLDFCIVALKTPTTDDPNTNMSRLSRPRSLSDAKNDPKRPRCPVPVSINREAADSIKKGDPITICQHPSRAGYGGYRMTATWKVLDVQESTLEYKNHTEKGCSGAPIYDSKAELVGIHVAGGTPKQTPNPTVVIPTTTLTLTLNPKP